MRYVQVFMLALALSGSRGQKKIARVVEGESDCDHRYPFVGAFISLRKINSFINFRFCTGSVISPKWVLTAGHCVKQKAMHRQLFVYGDLSLPVHYPSGRATKVLRGRTLYFDSLGFKNDIGLVMIEAVKLDKYGKVSSLDYKSLVGYAVEYAGAGLTYPEATLKNKKLWRESFREDQKRPLQIGQGVVAKCDWHARTPAICLRPKCSDTKQRIQKGDSGGPLFYEGKIVAVAASKEHLSRTDIVLTQFTPVSPFLDWIKDALSETETR